MDNYLALETTLVAFSIILFLHRRWAKRSTAPEAGGAWPIIGHLHLLGGAKPPHITLGDMADKVGPMFSIKLGVHRALVVSSSEVARECLYSHDKVFASRPKSVAMETLGYNSSMFGFSPYGHHWRQARKIATVELLSHHRLEKLKNVRESETSLAVKEIHQVWRNKSEAEDGAVSMEMKNWFSNLAVNLMFRMITGKRFAGATTEREAEGEGKKAMRDFFELTGRLVVADVFPRLRWMDLGGHEKEMKKTAVELDELIERWLEEHKEMRNNNVCDEEKQDEDFMDVMLSLVEDDSNKLLSDITDMNTFNKSICLGLILAGSDTSSVTLTWALSLLLNNRGVLKKAQQELDTHVGRERQVQESDLTNLIYLQAILKETFRLYPAAPLLIPHESIENCTVNGYHVPAGTRVLINVSKIHRDERIWPNPHKFEPERFLDVNKNWDVRGKNFEFIPFSSGRRMCPGISLALQVTQLALAKLLHGFEIETPFGAPIDMAESSGITNLKSSPLDVLLTPRLPSKLYA